MRSMGKKMVEKSMVIMDNMQKIAMGEEEYRSVCEQFFKDGGGNMLTDPKALKELLEETEQVCVEDKQEKTENYAEYIAAYTDQRDLNYAYSERKRLFQAGWDTKLGDEYRAGFTQETIAQLGKLEKEG